MLAGRLLLLLLLPPPPARTFQFALPPPARKLDSSFPRSSAKSAPVAPHCALLCHLIRLALLLAALRAISSHNHLHLVVAVVHSLQLVPFRPHPHSTPSRRSLRLIASSSSLQHPSFSTTRAHRHHHYRTHPWLLTHHILRRISTSYLLTCTLSSTYRNCTSTQRPHLLLPLRVRLLLSAWSPTVTSTTFRLLSLLSRPAARS